MEYYLNSICHQRVRPLSRKQKEVIDKKSLKKTLVGVKQSEYGGKFRDHTLEIYKIYLELTDKNSARRDTTNRFFLAINTALIALLVKAPITVDLFIPKLTAMIIPLAGAAICFLWYRIIKSFRDLNSAKFQVIHELEKYLPFKPYEAEWEGVGRGKKPNLYLPYTHIERFIPWIFFTFYLVLIVANIPCNVFQ